MHILGVGLSKTGTTSLHRALGILGLRSLHYDDQRLNDIICGTTADPNFRRYDDVDAVLDIPAAWFFEELLDAYPNCKCILTVRNVDHWWKSIRVHFNERSPVRSEEEDPFKWALRNYVYGSIVAREFLFKKRYREHNKRVLSKVPASQLLKMDITGGDGWEVLCPFLGKSIPNVPFPHQNRREENDPAYWRKACEQIQELVPKGKRFVLVDGQAFERDLFLERQVMPLIEREGQDWGPPENDEMAIRELERLQDLGPSHIIFAWPAFWWLDHYTAFQQYLRTRYPCILQNDQLVVFSLTTTNPCLEVRRGNGDL